MPADPNAPMPTPSSNLVPRLRPNDVVAILSNGGFDNIYEKLPAALTPTPRR